MRPVTGKARHWLGLLLTLWLLALPVLAAPQLVASLDRQQIRLDESVQLQLRYQGQAQQAPDFSPLNADFDIISSGQRSVVNWVNGRQQSSMGWVLLLAPKRSGQLQIPALQLQGARSEPLTLTVTDSAVAGGELPLFMLADISPQTGFEQSELRYRLRIFSAVTIREGSLSEPEADGLQLSSDGDEKRYHEQRNGRDYLVIERHYRAVPQRSGELQIPPVILDARITDEQSSYRSAMDFLMDPGRVVRLRSNPVAVTIKPRPAAVTGWFLPATAVSLSQRWQPQPPRLEVGKAITRVIRLEAKGAAPAQLPQLKLGEIAGVRQYLEQEERRSEETAAGPVAVLEQAISLIPLQPGPLTLPELRVEWWDSRSDSPQVAVLPATTVQVLGAVGSNADAADRSATGDQPAAAVNGDEAAAGDGSNAEANGGDEPQAATPGLLNGGLMALLIATAVAVAVLGWLLWRRRQSPSPLASARHQLLQACRSDNAHGALHALNRFTRAGGQLPAAAKPQIDQLHAALYGPTPQPWRGQALAQLLAPGRRWRQQPKADGAGLPPLYPR